MKSPQHRPVSYLSVTNHTLGTAEGTLRSQQRVRAERQKIAFHKKNAISFCGRISCLINMSQIVLTSYFSLYFLGWWGGKCLGSGGILKDSNVQKD